MTRPPDEDWRLYSQEHSEQCQARRERVLAWPNIAARLCQPPLALQRPEQWSGYIPPTLHQGNVNPSKVRQQLLDICFAVKQAEETSTQDNPVAPQEATERTLQLLAINAKEYLQSDDDGERMLFLTAETGREITSSKDLTEEEATGILAKLRQLLRLEKEAKAKAARAAVEQAKAEVKTATAGAVEPVASYDPDTGEYETGPVAEGNDQPPY